MVGQNETGCDEPVATYGFGGRYHGVFEGLESQLSEIIECPDPEGTAAQDRRALRLEAETDKFDPEHYAADFAWTEPLRPILDYEIDVQGMQEMSDTTLAGLAQISKSAPAVDDPIPVLCEVADVVFAFLYELRTTEGEMNVESGWTISRVSATLSWLERFSSPREAVLAAFHRSLAYPLYRSFRVSEQVLQDLKTVFELGKPALLHCLLGVRAQLDDDEGRQLLNVIYLDDLCVWVAALEEAELEAFAEQLSEVRIVKADIVWDLDEIEVIVGQADSRD